MWESKSQDARCDLTFTGVLRFAAGAALVAAGVLLPAAGFALLKAAFSAAAPPTLPEAESACGSHKLTGLGEANKTARLPASQPRKRQTSSSSPRAHPEAGLGAEGRCILASCELLAGGLLASAGCPLGLELGPAWPSSPLSCGHALPSLTLAGFSGPRQAPAPCRQCTPRKLRPSAPGQPHTLITAFGRLTMAGQARTSHDSPDLLLHGGHMLALLRGRGRLRGWRDSSVDACPGSSRAGDGAAGVADEAVGLLLLQEGCQQLGCLQVLAIPQLCGVLHEWGGLDCRFRAAELVRLQLQH